MGALDVLDGAFRSVAATASDGASLSVGGSRSTVLATPPPKRRRRARLTSRTGGIPSELIAKKEVKRDEEQDEFSYHGVAQSSPGKSEGMSKTCVGCLCVMNVARSYIRPGDVIRNYSAVARGVR